MNRRIERLAFLQLCGLGVIAGALGYWQLLRAPELTARTDNPRRLQEQLKTVRGRMFDRKGRPLATTEVGSDGYVRRKYTHPALGSVLGFLNPGQGITGLEGSYDDQPSGRAGLDPVTAFQGSLLHRPIQGSDLYLTLDLDLQDAAEKALATGPDTPGAAVVIDPRTGAVRALATTPTFDPNKLTFDPTLDDWDAANKAIAAYSESLAADDSRPLLNRATQGLYVPGSTFKTLTLSTSLERGVAKPSDRLSYQLKPADRNHTVPWHDNQFVSCQNHGQTGQFDVIHAFAYSCNVAFSELGLKIGREAYLETVRRFGFESQPPFPIPVETSHLNNREDFFTGQEASYALASTAMGQGELSVTPLQMALVATALAGNGSVPAPYLVEEIRRPDGTVVDRHRPATWQPGVSASTAATVRDIMVTSVDEGWASGAKIPGAKLGGKTGTAELGGGTVEPHTWFIGFATSDDPRAAIAVMKENSGLSSAVAAPAAKIIFEAALKFA
jgi:peptidoglycan glycosyltransferase